MSKDFNVVKEDIRAILVSSGSCLTIRQLEKDYHKFNGENIPYGRYGFSTILGFLQFISDVVLIRGTDVYPIISNETENLKSMIQKQRKPTTKKPRFQYKFETPSNNSNKFRYLPGKEDEYSFSSSITSQLSDREPPFPDLDSDDEVFFIGFPSNAVRLSKNITFPNDITELMEPISGFYLVQICAVRSPYKFWFQLKANENFDQMNIEMQYYYDDLNESDFAISETDIREKIVCAIKHSGKWYRGEIVSPEPDDNGDYKIFCFDFGEILHINPRFIKFLANDFGKVPRQAFRGRLAYVMPKDNRWSCNTMDKLRDLVSDVELYAELVHYNKSDRCHYLTLYHTHTAADINVAKYLVRSSDALASELKGKESIKLGIPTFTMLEEGLALAPTFTN